MPASLATIRLSRRTIAFIFAALVVITTITIPTLVVGANAVGRGPSGVALLPAAQAPSQVAAVANKRVGARDSMTVAASKAAVRHQRAVMQAEMFARTTTSKATLDMRGIEPSLYQGQFFDPASEEVRKCIVKRESEGQYDVRGGGGNNYFGAYQMSDALGDGATHMMLKEHKGILGVKQAKELMAELRDTPVNQWPRYWQDAAFSTVYNWEGPGSGASHWAGGRWYC